MMLETGIPDGAAVDAVGAEPVGPPPHPSAVPDLAERTWLARHRRGDPTAFPELLGALQSPVYSFIARCGIHHPTKDDLFQEIFMKIHAAAGRYDPHRPLKPWVFTIAANVVRNHLRQAGPRALPVEHELPEPFPAADEALERERTVAWVRSAIASLPLEQREVLVLVTLQGLSQAAVSEALEIPVNTVKTRLHRARLRLAQGLAQRRAGEASC